MLKALARSRAVLLTIALLAATWSSRDALREAFTAPDYSITWRYDADRVMLKQGIDAAPRFRDTLRWWTGRWIGCLPFWRPVSSYAFWAMWKTFGWEHQDPYVLVLVVSHLAACMWLFVLVETVTKRGLAACLAVVLFNTGLDVGGYSLVEGRGLGYLLRWICVPDAWLAMCALPALWATWRGKLWWAVLPAAVAAGVKETGFVLFPLVAGLYWWRHRRRHRALWVLLAVGALLAAVRLVFVGPGWIMGSNRWMLWRMYLFIAGEPLTVLASHQAPAAIIGIALAIGVLGWRSRWLRYGGIPVGVAIASLVAWRYAVTPGQATPYVVALCQTLDWSWVGRPALGVAVWVVAAYAGMRGPDRASVILFILAYFVLGLPATLGPQTGTRSLYTAYMMSSAVAALCAWAMGAAVLGAVREHVAGRGPLVGEQGDIAAASGDG